MFIIYLCFKNYFLIGSHCKKAEYIFDLLPKSRGFLNFTPEAEEETVYKRMLENLIAVNFLVHQRQEKENKNDSFSVNQGFISGAYK